MQQITTRLLRPCLTAGLIVAGFVLCLAVDLPGHLSYDSVIQLLEGRTGEYWGWHPPVMSWLLGLFDSVMPGTAVFVVFDVLLFFGALVALVFLREVRSWAAALFALLVLPLPIVLIYQGIVWKDVLFANTAVAGFVALAWAAARWRNPRLRYALLMLSVVLLSLAAMARQNGLLMLGMAVLALGVVAWQGERDRRVALAHAAGFAAALVVLITACNVALGLRLVGPSGPAKQFRLLELYDITGFAAADRNVALNELHAYAPALEREVRGDGARLYNPQRNDPLAASARLQEALEAAPWNAVRGQWLDLIVHHPWTYLKLRAEVFRWIFATPDISVCLPYLTGVSGPEEEMRTLNIAERDDDALSAYAGRFIGTPVLSHVFYAVLSLASLVLLLRRRRPEDIAIAALQAGALLFTLSFFVIAIACDYRYLYALDIAALVGVFYVLLDLSDFSLPLRRA